MPTLKTQNLEQEDPPPLKRNLSAAAIGPINCETRRRRFFGREYYFKSELRYVFLKVRQGLEGRFYLFASRVVLGVHLRSRHLGLHELPVHHLS